MPKSDAVASIGAWMLENGHRAILAATGGRWPKKLAGMQTVELHAKGRKSGNVHSTWLTAPICEPDRVILVASKGGHSEHPQWYKNLDANPDVELTIEDDRKPYTARTASADERAELWNTITSRFKNYAGYQASTDREIPVVICEPA